MKYLQVCLALYDYEARTPDEITVQENDILYVIDKEDDDWWKAELKQTSNEEPGPIGLVPAAYMEEVTPIGKVRAEYDYDAQQEEELTFSEGQEMWLLERDDPDWYLVKLDNGTIGLAPANYVQDIENSTDTPATPNPIVSSSSSPPLHPPVPTPVATPSAPTPPTLMTPPNLQVKTTPTTKEIDDEAQSWTVHDYDVVKKKKKKSKGNLLVGNAMLCYGSETDKTSPVQQYPILDVQKYLFDGKNLHIEIDGANSAAVLDLQASSKSEAKAILVKITDSRKAAQVAGTQVSRKTLASATPTSASPLVTAISPPPPPQPFRTTSVPTTTTTTTATTTATATTNEPRWAISLYAFTAEGGEEISVDENQQVLVTDYDRDDGWWRVETIDGKTGILPTSYIEFHDNNNSNNSDNHQLDQDDVDHAAHDEVEAYMRAKEQREREEQAEMQQHIDRTEQLERERRQQAAAAAAEEEEEQIRKAEQLRRDEEERERRRKVQEAHQRQEVARQRQMEEERKRRESSVQSSSSLSRSMSTRQDLPKPDPDRLRTWTDRSGSFKVEAQFLGYTDGKLRLHKANGVKIDVPLERMSAEDIRWVERRTNQPVGSTTTTTTTTTTAQVEKTPEMPTRPTPVVESHNTGKKKVNASWDWFDWLMMIGIPMQEALVYSSAFKADQLDDSDLEKLTHKQMKMLGMKENHVQRMERFIDTGKVEPASDDKNDDSAKTEEQLRKQIEADEEMARRLQNTWEEGTGKRSVSRPKPAVSAPKGIHPDLLDLLGPSTDTSATVETNSSNNELIGFSDDAWAPRPAKETTSQPLSPQQAPPPPIQPVAVSSFAPPPPPPPPVATPPAPQPPISQPPAPQAPAQQTPPIVSTPQQQKTIDPTLLQWQKASSSNDSPQPVNRQQLTLNQLSQQEQLQKYQQQQRQQALLEQQQQIIMQQQHHIQQQQLQQQQQQIQQLQQQATGYQNNAAVNGLVLYNNGMQQPQMTGYVQPQQPQMTGYVQPQQQPQQPQQQPQMTGFVQQPTMTNPTYQQPLQPQVTGRNWATSTPDNPFGSPSPLHAQITGVQFSTPNPNAFNQSPIQSSPAYLQQLQPQMTGIQQTELSGARDKYAAFRTPNADVFTPQPGFPQHRNW